MSVLWEMAKPWIGLFVIVFIALPIIIFGSAMVVIGLNVITGFPPDEYVPHAILLLWFLGFVGMANEAYERWKKQEGER